MRRAMKGMLLVCFMMAWAVPAFAMGPDPDDGPGPGPGFAAPSPEMMNLFAEVGSAALLQDLKLTPTQRQQIKAQLATVRPDLEAMRTKAKDFQNTTLKNRLTKALAELKAGRKPAAPDATEQAAFLAFQRENRALRLKARMVTENIVDLLTPEQREALQNHDPRSFLGMPGGDQPADKDKKADRPGRGFQHGPGQPGDGEGPMMRRHIMLLLSDAFYNAL